MDAFGPTDSGKMHVFKIKVIDNDDQSVNVTLNVTINPKA